MSLEVLVGGYRSSEERGTFAAMIVLEHATLRMRMRYTHVVGLPATLWFDGARSMALQSR